MKKHCIQAVETGSIAEEIGLQAGGFLLDIDGEPIGDILDYRYRISRENIEATFETASGELVTAEIDKDEDEDLGLSFDGLLDKKRGCANNCIFCFVDQLPESAREPLWFKDDDWRLSFLTGNYITLTNTSDKELQRIIDQRITPLYISVHSLDMDVRERMLRNKRARELERQLKMLCEAGIRFHCQIVLLRHINDGQVLSDTLRGLFAMRPCAIDCAIVPVGLTAHREGLYPLEVFDQKSAAKVIEEVEALAQEFAKEDGAPFVYCADEFYTLSGRELPPYAYYGEFGQLEDGIGMLRYFEHGFDEALAGEKERKPFRATLATSQSAYAFMQEKAALAREKMGIDIDVIAIPNRFFGGHVSVAGLLTGSDYYNKLSKYKLGEVVLLSADSLRKEDHVFLDDMSLDELHKKLGVEVVPIKSDGKDLVDVLANWRN